MARLLVLLLGAALAAAQPLQRPWPQFQVWLWTFGDRPLKRAWLRSLPRYGITGINREGTAPAELLGELGLTYYVGHAVGKGILALTERSFRKVWGAYEKKRDPELLVRPQCLRDPEVRAKLKRRLEATVAAQSRHGPLAYSLADEISITRRLTPLDFCYSRWCLAAFRRSLQARYRSLERLNRVWRTRFPSWEAVRPFTADEIKARERRMPPERWVLAPWADHRAFMDQTLAETLAWLRAEARRLGVRVPVGFLGGQAPGPYGGYDWHRLVRVVDWVEAYDEGGAPEVVRGLAPELVRVQTLFLTRGGEGRNRYRLWRLFAHGAAGIILWNDRAAFTPAGEPTRSLEALAPLLRTLQSPAARPLLGAPVAHDGIALLYSQAAIQWAWMWDSRRDGPRWLRRFGSYERRKSSHYEARRTWHYLLEAAGYQYRYVAAPDVAAQGIPAWCRVLILPGRPVLDEPLRTALKQFLARGGWVLVDRPAPGLETFLAHRRVRVVRRPQGLLRRPEARRAAVAAVRALLREAGVRPPAVVVPGAAERTYELLRRPTAKGTYWFVLPLFTPTEAGALPEEAWSRPEPVTLRFPAPVRARNVFRPGSWAGREATAPVAPDRPWVFRVTDA